jgi:hypothetical protein
MVARAQAALSDARVERIQSAEAGPSRDRQASSILS